MLLCLITAPMILMVSELLMAEIIRRIFYRRTLRGVDIPLARLNL